MKASESRVVAEARKAAKGQLTFFNRMMAVKTSASSDKKAAPSGAYKKSGTKKK
jgi:hypothetical protein